MTGTKLFLIRKHYHHVQIGWKRAAPRKPAHQTHTNHLVFFFSQILCWFIDSDGISAINYKLNEHQTQININQNEIEHRRVTRHRVVVNFYFFLFYFFIH